MRCYVSRTQAAARPPLLNYVPPVSPTQPPNHAKFASPFPPPPPHSPRTHPPARPPTRPPTYSPTHAPVLMLKVARAVWSGTGMRITTLPAHSFAPKLLFTRTVTCQGAGGGGWG